MLLAAEIVHQHPLHFCLIRFRSRARPVGGKIAPVSVPRPDAHYIQGVRSITMIPENESHRDRNDETAADRVTSALSAARRLIKFGVPVFPARVDENGDPDFRDPRWSRWQRYPADLDILSTYQPGDALGAVCGVTFDVIDVDPRNGGIFSFKRLIDELGDDGPVVYGRVKTPSGGMHYYIAALGIGKHTNILPGIDLQGGYPDGTGRGFVFLPPTIRPVKGLETSAEPVRMGTYRWVDDIQKPGGDASSEELTSYITAAIQTNKSSRTEGYRESTDALRASCIQAPQGQQRTEMLKYVHEMERRGYAKADIIMLLQTLAAEMPLYDKMRPWYPARSGNPDKHLLDLFHKPGQVIPDATPGELDGINEGPSVARVIPTGLTAYSEVSRELTQWLWMRYLAIGNITIFDGDAGIGKSLVTLDVGARVSNGDDMPDGTRCTEPGSILLLAPEDSDSVIAGRLEAANATSSRIYKPSIVLRKKRGNKESKAYSGGDVLAFPSSTDKVKGWIKAYGIRLMIVDPITAFLDEDINSNNDASVRRALSRLGAALEESGCSAVFVRHYNKNTQLSAQQRGGGSVAFGAVSRIQLIGGQVPSEELDQLDNPPETKVFAITQVKNNHLGRRPDEALAYTIEDSDIVADTDGNMAPRVRWLGKIMVTADTLASGPAKKRPGPIPAIQEEIIEALSEMFASMSVIDSAEAMGQLRNAGISANKETIAKARKSIGIISRARRIKGQSGVSGWDWVLRTKQRVNDEEDDE